jgi:hypothetical protein
VSVSGLINAVINQGSAVGLVKQISDPRLTNTGGELDAINGRSYLVFGQSFQGGYNGSNASFSQIYTDEVRSFRIVDKGSTLAIANYVAQRDPVNFRRRDYNLVPTIVHGNKPALESLGGAFTPNGSSFLKPIVIGPGGTAKVNYNYQQYFTQYNSARVSLYDAHTGSSAAILFGGISLYDYNFATGTLSSDPDLPFVDDVTSVVTNKQGAVQEYIMPSQLPGRFGANAAFFATPGLPTYSNGVIKLDQLTGPTTLGYIYGGIYSTVGDTSDPGTQTTATNTLFKVTLVPV